MARGRLGGTGLLLLNGSRELGATLTRRPRPPVRLSPAEQTKSPLSGGFARLRGKDSNLDYLIQSQASYH